MRSVAEIEVEVTPNPSPQPNGGSGLRLGTVVLIATIAIAALGLTVAVIVLDNALDGRIRDRTIFGVALMVIGFLGPIMAVVALRRRRSLRQMGLHQWGSLVLFPGSFLVLWPIAFLMYAVLGPVGKPIISYTPTFIVSFNPEGRPQCNAQGSFGGSEQIGPGEVRADGVLVNGSFDFYYRVFPDESGIRAVTLTGEIECAEGKRVELRGELLLAEKFWFRIEGPAGAVLVIDDQPRVAPILLEAGTHRVVVRRISGE